MHRASTTDEITRIASTQKGHILERQAAPKNWSPDTLRNYVDAPSIDDVKRTGERPCVKTLKPYYYVKDLTDLQGPAEGIITLPHHVRTLPLEARTVNISITHSRQLAYTEILQEADTRELEDLLNKELLIADWPHLRLPRRVVHLWEEKFPELSGAIPLG